MNNMQIMGVGHALGNEVIHNRQFESILETSDEWINSRTGISQRTFSTIENTSDLAVRAAIESLKDANMSSKEIDCIIVATMTPDNITPATAPIVQNKLNMNDQKCVAFDVNGACTGFIYALQIAASMINANQINNALVIGAETFSKVLDFTDRSTAILFGDGAGAVILSRSMTENQMHFYAQSKGDLDQQIFVKGLDLRDGMTNKNQQIGYLQMNGPEVFRFASFAITDAINKIVETARISINDIDLIIPHQANERIIKYASKQLEIPMDRFYTNLKDVGNTSAASIPIALSQAKKQNMLVNRKNLVFVGFGAGLTWGSVYIALGGKNDTFK